MQVLAGVEQVHDLGGLGELGGGDVPDPGGAVAEDGGVGFPDVAGAAADALGLRQGEHVRGLERGHCSGGIPVTDGVASSSSTSFWVKNTPSLTSRVRARPSSPLPSAPRLLAVTGTPVPSIAAYSLSGGGDGGSGISLRSVIALAGSPDRGRAAAVPLASAARSTRLAVRRAPARFSSGAGRPSRTARRAATWSFIARRPGDIAWRGHAEPGVPGGKPVAAGRAVVLPAHVS